MPLIDCPSGNSEIKRNEIRELLSEGYTKDQIKKIFLEKYGPTVLITPPFSGFSLLVWVIPFLALGVAGYFIYQYIQQRKNLIESEDFITSSESKFEQEIENELLQSQIEDEMKKYR